MLTTSLTSASTARPTRAARAARAARANLPTRASAATYRRRRGVAALLVVGAASAIGLGGLAAQGVLTGPGGVPASAAGAGTAPPVVSVRAEPGDSLWAIAERFHGDVGLQHYVDALIDLNGGTAITAGQLVRLP